MGTLCQRLETQRPWVVVGWLTARSVMAPSLYFVELQLTCGVRVVLLTTTKALFTALLAFVIFRKALTRRSPAIIGGAMSDLGRASCSPRTRLEAS